MTPEPAFIDNRDGNTLARALGEVLGVDAGPEADETSGAPGQVRIATAFFSPTGFAHIAERLATVPTVRLLLGDAPLWTIEKIECRESNAWGSWRVGRWFSMESGTVRIAPENRSGRAMVNAQP